MGALNESIHVTVDGHSTNLDLFLILHVTCYIPRKMGFCAGIHRWLREMRLTFPVEGVNNALRPHPIVQLLDVACVLHFCSLGDFVWELFSLSFLAQRNQDITV